MMTVLSRKIANHEKPVVEVRTIEARILLISLDGPDTSGGLRDVYSGWARLNETSAHSASARDRSAFEHFVDFGFDDAALMALSDMERRFAAQFVELSSKCAATRAWNDAAQVACASGQTLPDAPYTLPELLSEIALLLQP